MAEEDIGSLPSVHPFCHGLLDDLSLITLSGAVGRTEMASLGGGGTPSPTFQDTAHLLKSSPEVPAARLGYLRMGCVVTATGTLFVFCPSCWLCSCV